MFASWRELEELSTRLEKLYDRHRHAEASHNVGQAEMLRQEIAHAERQRDALVAHMSTRMIGDA